MLLSVEGIAIPDVRNATADDEASFSKLLDKANNLWLKKPRRITVERLQSTLYSRVTRNSDNFIHMEW